MNSFTFSISGFDAASAGLIQSQLDIIETYLASSWRLCDFGEQVDLVISKGDIAENAYATLSIQLIEDLRILREGEFEWPLRVISLMDLLNFAAKSLSVEAAVDQSISMAEWMSGQSHIGKSDIYVHAITQVYISIADGTLKTNAESKSDLVDLVHSSNMNDWVKSDEVSILKPGLELQLSSFLWTLGLKESEYALHKWNKPDALYRMLSWPQLGQWESTSQMFRLASLYGRKAASIKTGVMVSGLSETDVCTFLHACFVSGVKVNTCSDEEDTVTQPPIDASLSVLQAFKAKLGL